MESNLSPDDSSKELDEKLIEWKDRIEKLQELCHDILDPVLHDDIYLLRFLLSNKTPENAEEAVRFTIAWRNERKDLFEKMKIDGEIPYAKVISQFQVARDHGTTNKLEPIYYVRIGASNTAMMMDVVSKEDVLNYQILSREKTLIYCDQMTRKERRLIKAVTVLDMQGFSLAKSLDPRFLLIIGQTSKLSEKMYPQLLGKSIILNPPNYFSWVFAMVKPLLSKRTLEKVALCPGSGNDGRSILDCPYVTQFLNKENVPSFLGGDCECNGGACIGNTSNKQKVPSNEFIDDEGKVLVTINPRDEKIVEIAITRGQIFEYSFEVDSFNIDISAIVIPKDGEEGLIDQIVVIEKLRLEHSDGVNCGSFISPVDGTLVVNLNNSFSVFRSKKIKYRISPQVLIDHE